MLDDARFDDIKVHVPALSRWLNIALGVFFSLIVAATMPGTWDFYITLGIVEVTLTSIIAWLAWRWRRYALAAQSESRA